MQALRILCLLLTAGTKGMKDLIIIGAGGFGREVLQWIKDCNSAKGPTWNVLGFIDDNLEVLNNIPCDKEVIGKISDHTPSANVYYTIALALPSLKKKIALDFKSKGAEFANIYHPKAIVSEFCEIGEGVILTANAKLSPNVKLGNFVTLLGSGVGHDAELGDFSTISGYCSINGHVKVGEGAFIASNAVVAPGKKVGAWSYVGMGSMVISNVKEQTKVMGNPARRLKI